MQQLIEFITHHWALVSLFLIFLIWVIWEEIRTANQGRFGVAPQKLVQMINRNEVAIIDLRENNVFNEGHVIGSVNIPRDILTSNSKKLQKYKNQTIVLVSNNNDPTMALATQLQKQGYEKIAILSGGITAWKNSDLPLVKG